MMRRSALGMVVWLLAAAAHAQAPDGSELAPPASLTTRDGVWTWGAAHSAGNYRIDLGGKNSGGIGSRVVVANGGQVYSLQRDNQWYLWNGRWQRQAGPPVLPPVVTPPVTPPPEPSPEEAVLRVPQVHATLRTAINQANADNSDKYYVIEIAPGTYRDEFFEVSRPMTLKAAGGPVILEATVPPTNGKAVVVANANLTVDGLTFTGVRNASGNGAGIRDHNLTPDGRLTIRNSTFTGNDTGVLTDNRSPTITVTVENSKFVNNGSPSIANPHALYVNSGRLTVTGSLFCGQLRGHNIKSRASVNEITDNRIYDGAAAPELGCNQGSSGMAIDLSNGGVAMIRNNTITQGPGSSNFALMSYGAEGLTYQVNRLVITGNTFRSPGTAHSTVLRDPTCTRNRPGSVIADNIFEDIRTQLDPVTCTVAQ